MVFFMGGLVRWSGWFPAMRRCRCRPTVTSFFFAPFHEHGLTIPPHPFFRGLLHHYQVELQHLNPNKIQHIVAFIAMCEGYLGIEPHFELWRYFFAISLHRKNRVGRSWCRWDAWASISGGSGWASTCPASCLDPTRGGMCMIPEEAK